MKPMLLIDVDGPLNPYAANPKRRPDGYTTFYVAQDSFNTYAEKSRSSDIRVWVNPSHGEKFLALTEYADLVWCTTWNDHANSIIAPRIGLPTLPYVNLQFRPAAPGLYWKTPQVISYVEDRPFIWIDDETTSKDYDYISLYMTRQFDLHIVNPAKGLLDADFEALKEKLQNM